MMSPIMKLYLAENMFRIPGCPLAVVRATQQPSMFAHCHDFVEMVLVGRGHSIHEVAAPRGGVLSYGLIQGDVFAIPPGEMHAYRDSRNLVIYNIAFGFELLDAYWDELSLLPSCRTLWSKEGWCSRIHLTPVVRQQAMSLLDRIIRELDWRPPGFRLSVRLLLAEFLLLVGREGAAAAPLTSMPDNRLLPVLTMLEKEPAHPYSLQDLAHAANMGVSSLTKKFREAVGTSIVDYRIRLQLDKSCKLLDRTELSVSEIAFECGFSDGNYMTKLFRRRHGMTPHEYRKRAGGGIHDE